MIRASRLILVLAAALLLPPMLKAEDAAKPAEKAPVAKAAVDAKAGTTVAKAAPAAKVAAKSPLTEPNALMDEGKLDEAIKAYEALGELKSKKSETWRFNNWGLCLIKQKKYAEAIPVLEKAIAVDANNDVALRNLGSCYVNTDQIDKAIETYKSAVEVAKAGNVDTTKAEKNLKEAEDMKAAAAALAEKKASKDAKAAGKVEKKAAPKKDAAKDEKKADAKTDPAPASTEKK